MLRNARRELPATNGTAAGYAPFMRSSSRDPRSPSDAAVRGAEFPEAQRDLTEVWAEEAKRIRRRRARRKATEVAPYVAEIGADLLQAFLSNWP